MKNRLFIAALSATIALTGCETPPPSQPANFTVSVKMPAPWRNTIVAPANAPPRILRIWLSRLVIAPGSTLEGAIATTTNVASVEVRTAAFSINSQHVAPGQFRFRTRVLELPPLARLHTYTLDVIARNTAGTAQVEQAPLEMK